MNKTKLDFNIAGISIRVTLPFAADVGKEFSPFLAENSDPAVNLNIELICSPLQFPRSPFYKSAAQTIYKTEDGWLRVYPTPSWKQGCAAILLRGNGNHTLYIPKDGLDTYSIAKNLLPVLGIEYTLMQNECILLHSSVVKYKGKIILFCGKSGAGKSTQAELWNRTLDAKIINGDRCVIAKRDTAFYGCGSPYAGSSDIFIQDEGEIASIVFVSHGKVNSISPTSKKEAFMNIYSQCILNPWDEEYTNSLCNFIELITSKIPMYSLSCLPNEDAVHLVKNTLFEK